MPADQDDVFDDKREDLFQPLGTVPKVGDYVSGLNSANVEPAQIVSIEDYRFHANTGGYFHKNHFEKNSSSGIRVLKVSPYMKEKETDNPNFVANLTVARKLIKEMQQELDATNEVVSDMNKTEDLLRSNLNIANKRIIELQEQLAFAETQFNSEVTDVEKIGLNRNQYFNHPYTQELRTLIAEHNLNLIFSTDGEFRIMPMHNAGRILEHKEELEPILAEAQFKVRGPREESYGEKKKNFTNIANLQAVMNGDLKEPEQISLDMICVKMARLINSPDHYDSLVDIIGYVMCYVDIRRQTNPDPYNEAETKFAVASRK